GDVPETDLFVLPRGKQYLAIRGKSHRIHFGLIPLELAMLITTYRVPQKNALFVTRSQELAIIRKNQCRTIFTVLVQGVEFLSCSRVKEADHAIELSLRIVGCPQSHDLSVWGKSRFQPNSCGWSNWGRKAWTLFCAGCKIPGDGSLVSTKRMQRF